MNYHYHSKIDHGDFVLTNFTSNINNPNIVKIQRYAIIWAQTRELKLTVDGYQVLLQRGQVIFCTPHTKVTWEEDRHNGGYGLIFNQEFYCLGDHTNEISCNGLLFYSSRQPPVLTFKGIYLEEIKMVKMMLERETSQSDSLQGDMIKVLLKQLLIISTRLYKETLSIDHPKNNVMSILTNFNILVEKNFREKHKVKEYAEIMNLSPKSISNIFYTYYKRKPSDIIANRIILEARKLLLYSDKNVSEVAYHLGFKDISHFSNFFKRHTGASPRGLRQNSTA